MRGPKRAATSGVASVDSSSTTITSTSAGAGKRWSRALSMARATKAARLYVGMMALNTAALTCSACHRDESVRGLGALGYETVVMFARVERAAAHQQRQAIAGGERQTHEQLPSER